MHLEDRSSEPLGIDTTLPVAARTWDQIATEAVLIAPNVAKLFVRLVRDPRVPVRRKMLVAAVAGYVLSPIDLIPDFIVGLGKLDDLILVSLALDHLLRGMDEAIVLEHWDGSIDALDLVRAVLAWGADILPRPVRRFLPE